MSRSMTRLFATIGVAACVVVTAAIVRGSMPDYYAGAIVAVMSLAGGLSIINIWGGEGRP